MQKKAPFKGATLEEGTTSTHNHMGSFASSFFHDTCYITPIKSISAWHTLCNLHAMGWASKRLAEKLALIE